eukprot:m.196891 g.196891  ORF g.196891 m.196891 type:complete len:122 (-) comp18336_c1_seq3:265-630(-)
MKGAALLLALVSVSEWVSLCESASDGFVGLDGDDLRLRAPDGGKVIIEDVDLLAMLRLVRELNATIAAMNDTIGSLTAENNNMEISLQQMNSTIAELKAGNTSVVSKRLIATASCWEKCDR